MKSEQMLFAGVVGLALAACAAPAATPEESEERLGKVTSAQTYSCQCFSQPGTWTGNYSSTSDVMGELQIYCPNGGGSCCASTSSCSSDNGSSGADGNNGGNNTGGSPINYPGSGSGADNPPSGNTGGHGSGSTPANHSDIARDAQFRITEQFRMWNGYESVKSEAGFNDGDSKGFFEQLKTAQNMQNVSAFSSLIPKMPYWIGVASLVSSWVSNAYVDELAAKYAATGRGEGIRVVQDMTVSNGVFVTFHIFNIADGAYIGQFGFNWIASIGSNGKCEMGTYGDVQLAVNSCSNGPSACNTGYNCQ